VTEDPRAAAEALARARARVPASARARAEAVSPSAPPPDEPRPGSPEDVGFVHRPARAARPAPRAAPTADPAAVLEGTRETGDRLFGPWAATVRLRDGRAKEIYGATSLEARRKALAWIEALP
jgi:hypothetical protein